MSITRTELMTLATQVLAVCDVDVATKDVMWIRLDPRVIHIAYLKEGSKYPDHVRVDVAVTDSPGEQAVQGEPQQ